MPRVLAATRRAQMRASGQDTAAIGAIAAFRNAMRHALRTDLQERPLLPNMTVVIDYLRSEMGYAGHEVFRVLFLDARHRLIRDEVMWTGTVDQCQVHIRTIVKRALELDACGLHRVQGTDPVDRRRDPDGRRLRARSCDHRQHRPCEHGRPGIVVGRIAPTR